jgi:hypothetical protein
MATSEMWFLILAFCVFGAFMVTLAYAASVAPGERIEK